MVACSGTRLQRARDECVRAGGDVTTGSGDRLQRGRARTKWVHKKGPGCHNKVKMGDDTRLNLVLRLRGGSNTSERGSVSEASDETGSESSACEGSHEGETVSSTQ